MSHKLISHSSDLARLRSEGYDVEVKAGYLLVKNVPYVNSRKEVKRGTLISKLTLAGDVTTKPDDHVAYFSGNYPCRPDGTEISEIKNASESFDFGDNIVADHRFSAKPQPSGYYINYHSKITTYAAILSGPAQMIDPLATPKTFPVIELSEDESVFHYIDTASSRAEITLATQKLQLDRVAIVGLGGTGSYVLDFIAKTPVQEIHLYDSDTFLQHNAFRSPGAPSAEELRAKPFKTTYLKAIYSKMHRGIIDHEHAISKENIGELRGMKFVFICIDAGSIKKLIVEKLEEFGVAFSDVGMGLYITDDSLGGIVRVTTSVPTYRNHIRDKNRISFSDVVGQNEYGRNIQIADLNALNAALAVIKWKKLFGFYHDHEREHNSVYAVGGNKLINEDQAGEGKA